MRSLNPESEIYKLFGVDELFLPLAFPQSFVSIIIQLAV